MRRSPPKRPCRIFLSIRRRFAGRSNPGDIDEALRDAAALAEGERLQLVIRLCSRERCIGASINGRRRGKIFKNGRDQAARIPREFELPGEDAIMRKEGWRLVPQQKHQGMAAHRGSGSAYDTSPQNEWPILRHSLGRLVNMRRTASDS